MRMALELARGCKGQTSPNPVVGAVVVKNGEVVGVGTHLKPGEPHAEVHALNMAGEQAEGSTVYVTLEPCSHTGRTPPCADTLVRHRVGRVVIAMLDPNPRVAGRGAERLKKAGIEVDIGLFKEEAARLNESFCKYIVTGMPFVTVKTASTLDGKIATVTGDSRWITGEEARREVHLMRHEHDVILVGVNTVIQDDPRLTTRLPEGGKNPVRVVLDSRLRIPLESQLIRDREAPTWIFTTDQADRERMQELEKQGIRVISTGSDEKVDIYRVLKWLGDNQFSSVLVEGGSQVTASFLQGKLIDKVVAYVSAKLIAGGTAPTSYGGTGIEKMQDAIELKDMEVRTLGQDICITGYPEYKGG
ncbi:MAG: bifunctional diaminohydroxyphosphoribosylaminopyrimidine deaminase/5-amino-6-(5-phosphoribosylamino)uracil reductase RibD [Bacillaceae bacterium]|nr:bifunctional diaminohydroxyphosphoribosylaminopyrimidine deaminase/5-amino-6-(5-phosphoribosylamino)uracil reductase RibD [Bacillaceae bacterium]